MKNGLFLWGIMFVGVVFSKTADACHPIPPEHVRLYTLAPRDVECVKQVSECPCIYMWKAGNGATGFFALPQERTVSGVVFCLE